jgi:hypothetical protein
MQQLLYNVSTPACSFQPGQGFFRSTTKIKDKVNELSEVTTSEQCTINGQNDGMIQVY